MSRPLTGRLAAALSAALGLAACTLGVALQRTDRAVEVTTVPVALDPSDPARTTLGELGWLGGRELRGPSAAGFGGISSMALLDRFGGTLLRGVTDEGQEVWLPLSSGARHQGRLTPLRGEDNLPLAGKEFSDAEGFAIGPGGFYVSFERRHRVLFYPNDRRTAPTPVGVPTTDLPENAGYEGLTWVPEARRLAIGAEDGRIWLCRPVAVADCDLIHGPGLPAPDYRLTELTKVPGRPELIVMYGAYAKGVGNRIVVSRLKLPFATGRDATVTELARLEPPLSVDNFEALTVSRRGKGYVVRLLSDDNFDATERTLLFDFAWTPRD